MDELFLVRIFAYSLLPLLLATGHILLDQQARTPARRSLSSTATVARRCDRTEPGAKPRSLSQPAYVSTTEPRTGSEAYFSQVAGNSSLSIDSS